MIKKVGEDYELRDLEAAEFRALWDQHGARLFDEVQPIFRSWLMLSSSETERINQLRERMGSPFRIYVGIYYKGEFIGWSWGYQESAETFYMCNSAVFEAHRRKGLYAAAMNAVLDEALAQGFQRIYSRHHTTNNAVIIPKLKAGFVIT